MTFSRFGEHAPLNMQACSAADVYDCGGTFVCALGSGQKGGGKFSGAESGSELGCGFTAMEVDVSCSIAAPLGFGCAFGRWLRSASWVVPGTVTAVVPAFEIQNSAPPESMTGVHRPMVLRLWW